MALFAARHRVAVVWADRLSLNWKLIARKLTLCVELRIQIHPAIVEPMKNGTSLYLDLVRFSAALVVFLEHLREHTKHSFSTFWRIHSFWRDYLNPLSLTAVMVFFVLSGYVIAHVLATRERTLLEYSASRFARLYSVVVPALILTAACNYLITLKFPHAFDSLGGSSAMFFDYLGTALFTSHFWLWSDLEPANAPFWSLSFEAAFYVGIALIVFVKGHMRILSLVMLCLIAGPTMVLLAPSWLLGYGVYHLSRHRQLGAVSAIVIWLISTPLLFLCPLIEIHFRQELSFLRMPDSTLGGLLASYAAASCFALNLVAFNAFSDSAEPLLRPFGGLIRWLGSLTFALYLFHQPLLSVFTVYSLHVPPSTAKIISLAAATFLIVVTVGRYCEQSKGAYKKGFLWIWARVASSAATIH